MPRARTTDDAYNAIAEPRRRRILELLSQGERAVQELVEEMEVGQPTVSGHLKVLKEVDLVHMRRDGRRRLYSVNAEALRPISRWIAHFEHLWADQLDRIQARAERDDPNRES